MSNFKNYLNEHKEIKLNESDLTISLKNGIMKVDTQPNDDIDWKFTVSYNGKKCSYIVDEEGNMSDPKGDVALCLSALIEQLFINGVVKSK